MQYVFQKATNCNATVGKGLNHNRADRALREWADCPCAVQQVHLLALDGTEEPVLAPPDGLNRISDLCWPGIVSKRHLKSELKAENPKWKSVWS